MEFVDLESQYRKIKPSIKKNMGKVLSHGQFIMGPEIFLLEKELRKYVGSSFCISCSNGTTAILMSLMSYGIKPNDAIFTPSFAFPAAAEAISLLGATPIFVDIDPLTFNMSVEDLNLKILKVINSSPISPGTPRSLNARGIIPINTFGLPANYLAIKKIAKHYKMFTIEDGAQSFGASYKGNYSGNLASVGTTSFYPAKPLGCYGDGGAIFTNSSKIASELLSIRSHGLGIKSQQSSRVGLNSRLDTLQASILLAKLKVFNKEMEKRHSIARFFSDRLSKYVTIQKVPDGNTSSWAQFSFLTHKRNNLQKYLTQQGIPSRVYYPLGLHLQKAFSYLKYPRGSLPATEKISKSILSVPIHPYLTIKEQRKIVDSIIKFFGKNSK